MPAPHDDAVELTDPRAIRAIAHPARLVVIEALYDQGRVLTATQAAELAGTTPSAMSYHLRALERYGIVRRGRSTGDARERPWTRAASDFRIRPSAATSPRAATLAASAVMSTAMDVARDRMLAALERNADTDAPKRPIDGAIGYMYTMVLVTIEEATALMESINELMEPFRVEHRTDAPDDAGRLAFAISTVPDPEPPGDRAHDEKRS